MPDAGDPYLLLRGIGPERPLSDWLTDGGERTVPPHPRNGAIVKQTPPVFRWRFQATMAVWELHLRLQDGSELRRMTADNWLFLDRALSPGHHGWRLRGWPKSGEATEWSKWRQFTVAKRAHEFLVPDFGKLFGRASRRPRPRLLPTGKAGQNLLAAIRTGAREKAYERLRGHVEYDLLGKPLNDEPPTPTYFIEDFYERRRAGRAIGRAGYRESGAARFAAYAWIGSNEQRYLDEAKRRVRNLASWDPRGSTGRRSHDSISREIALTLASVLDLTYDQWDDDERRRLIDIIVVRVQDIFDHYIAHGARPLRQMPYNSHGYRHAGAISAIASLLAGEVPRAQQWFLTALPTYIALNSPWGGEDGGFANSLSYAGWNVEAALRHWDILELTTGLQMLDAVWPRSVGRYLHFFAPPGTPDSIFGDGRESDMSSVWRRIAHLYAQRLPWPAYRRYAEAWGNAPIATRLVFGPMNGHLERLDGRRPNSAAASLPANIRPNAAHFPSIGWVAMHSDLDDPKRASVYFMASPYGSFNHSSAGQNGFVVHVGGRPLAIASGYYDHYGSDHHKGWTRQTKAHNAITFDGGRGQHPNSFSASGRIVGFRHTSRLDFVVGDAVRAYEGELRKAIRTVAFLRPDLLLIYDALAADEAKRWEWNIHSHEAMTVAADGSVVIADDPASLCIEMLAGPEVSFEQTDRFAAEPDRKLGEYPNQWHGRFSVRSASRDSEFLALIRIDCRPAALSLGTSPQDGGFELDVKDRGLLRIDADGARWLTP
jgi:hypothetical protein